MNKYQKALDDLAYHFDCGWNVEDDVFETLQELIDEYSKLDNAFETLGDAHDNLVDKCLQLEKALDKACEELEAKCILVDEILQPHYEIDLVENEECTKDFWKEWAMKDE